MVALQGAGVACFSMMAYKSLYFGLYDTAKPIVFKRHANNDSTRSSEDLPDADGESQPPILAKLALASVTTCLAASITYPLGGAYVADAHVCMHFSC